MATGDYTVNFETAMGVNYVWAGILLLLRRWLLETQPGFHVMDCRGYILTLPTTIKFQTLVDRAGARVIPMVR